MPLFYDPVYTDGIDPSARFPRERYRLVAEAMEPHAAAGLVDIRIPRRATRKELKRAHDPAYVDAFMDGTLDRKAIMHIGLRPWTDAIIDRTLALSGAALQATELVLEHGGLAASLAGGTHHAFHDRGGGYCIFNDLVLCARHAQKRGVKQVLVVDLDVHQGDGTAAMTAGDDSVFTFSMHCGANYPFTKVRSDLDVPLPAGTTDGPFLQALQDALPKALACRPDLILFQAGVDGLEQDKLGKLALSHNGMQARNHMVFEEVRRLGVPCIVLMGGGYGRPIEATVQAFEDLFVQAAECHQDIMASR